MTVVVVGRDGVNDDDNGCGHGSVNMVKVVEVIEIKTAVVVEVFGQWKCYYW